MAARDHRPHIGSCIYCLDPWPCDAAKLVMEVRADVAKEIRPNGPEPVCCDQHAAAWQALNDAADDIAQKEIEPWE